MQPNWFFAFPIPAETFLGQVLRHLPESCRGFDPEDVHMTLAFLGPLRPEQVPEMTEHLNAISAAPFSIALGGIRALPSPKRPTALSFELTEGRDRAAALIARHRDALLEAAGARPDPRPPLPHITVARPIRRYGSEGQRQALAWSQTCKPPSEVLRVTRIALYTWSEDRTTRQFKIVAERLLDAEPDLDH